VAPGSTSLDGTPAQFPPTLWSVVLKAGERSSLQSEQALATLCQAYWYPLYAYLRRQGRTSHDAEDLTQAFFLHLLERRALQQVHPHKGKFRSFLLASLKNFAADEWSKSQAQKRGGGLTLLSLDADVAEERYQADGAQQSLDPEKLFERRWAIALLDRVLGRLEAETTLSGRQDRFQQLRVFLSGDPPNLSYAQVAARLGMTEGAIKVAVLRLRQRYRDLFRAEIANTVAAAEDVDEELRHVIAILSS
jgi:RNA polymerase sigma factor (sigma-70 family)